MVGGQGSRRIFALLLQANTLQRGRNLHISARHVLLFEGMILTNVQDGCSLGHFRFNRLKAALVHALNPKMVAAFGSHTGMPCTRTALFDSYSFRRCSLLSTVWGGRERTQIDVRKVRSRYDNGGNWHVGIRSPSILYCCQTVELRCVYPRARVIMRGRQWLTPRCPTRIDVLIKA